MFGLRILRRWLAWSRARNTLIVGQVGDSRVYLARNGKHIITRAVGLREYVEVDDLGHGRLTEPTGAPCEVDDPGGE